MAITPAELASRLNRTVDSPDDIPSDEDVRKDVAEVVEAKSGPKNKIDLDDPRAQEKYTFKFSYTDARGKEWAGDFSTKILTIHERQMVGALRAQWGGGLPVSAMDALTNELNLMLAHLTYSLSDKPTWAANLRKLQDFQLLQKIYEEVASHEAYFLGWGSDSTGGRA